MKWFLQQLAQPLRAGIAGTAASFSLIYKSHMHCSPKLELLCGVILIDWLQRSRHNQLLIYLNLSQSEQDERHCGNPPRCSGVCTRAAGQPLALQCIILVFSWWKCVHPDGLKRCLHHSPPHTDRRDETREQHWKHLNNELLVTATLQTRSAAQEKIKKLK